MKEALKHSALIFLLFFAVNLCGQDSVAYEDDTIVFVEEEVAASPAAAVENGEEAIVKQHQFDEDKWNKLRGELDYTEEKKKETKEDLDIDPGINWNFNEGLVKIIFWIVIGVLVVVILVLFLRNRYFAPKNHKIKKETTIVSDYIPENIAELNLRDLLESAVKSGSYKEAIRMYYLIVLRDLNDKNLIILKKNSISRDFLQAMHGHGHYRKFALLTRLFEKVWYGDYDITTENFSLASAMFEEFISAINPPKA